MSPNDRSSLAPILLGCVVAIAVLHAASQPVSTNDLHIFAAMGRQMEASGEILRTETFTWTAAGSSFANPTWGFSCLAWVLYETVGVEGLRLVNGVMVGWSLIWVALAARALGAEPRGCALASFYAWLLMLQNLSVRGQTWVFWLLPAAVVLAARPHGRWLQLLGGLVIGALWSNLHGSFPVALIWLAGLGGGALLSPRDRSAAASAGWTALGLGLGSLCNPEVSGVWTFLWDNSSSPVQRGFVEWYPPDWMSFAGARLLLAGLLWALLCLRRRPPWTALGLVLAFGLLATQGTRFIAWFGLATAPLLGLWIKGELQGAGGWPRRWVQGLGLAMAALFIGLGIRLLPGVKGLHPLTPTHAVATLRSTCGECAGERILNPPEYGGYLNLEVPGLKTSGDIRSWVFDAQAWSVYLALSEAPSDWEQRLQAAEVHWLLLWRPTQDQTLIPAVEASPDWEVLSRDEMSLLARRRPQGLAPLSKPPIGE